MVSTAAGEADGEQDADARAHVMMMHQQGWFAHYRSEC
jgi:hypothetical protein